MGSLCKVKISGDVYDISPAPNGNLNTTGFISNDAAQSSAASYTSVDPIANTDTNATIFGKLTSMVKNIRFLYNTIGNTDISTIGSSLTEAISNLFNRHNSVYMGILLVSAWNNNSQTLTCPIVSSSNTIIVVPQSAGHFNFGVTVSSQNEGSITFSCASVPTDDIPVQIVALI